MDLAAIPALPAVAIIAYMMGSIPFGILVSAAFGLGDPRATGSGNIGATNVLRSGNKAAAAATLLLDAGKGFVAVILAAVFFGESMTIAIPIAATAAVIGHCFPVWLRFRGGKGVATGIAVILAMNWIAGLIICAVWLATAIIGRMSSLASLAAMTAAPFALLSLALLGLARWELLPGAVVVAAVIFARHRENIARIREGREPKIGA